MKRLIVAVATAAAALMLAVPAQAQDIDTDFTNELHTYGIYGQKDYNAWIGKITCKRQRKGIDKDAFASANFVRDQLPRSQNSTEQTWKFLAGALRFYCPDLLPILDQARDQGVLQ